MRFTKLHGSGNDFIVIDARDRETDWINIAKSICDRHLGAGADGLLLVYNSDAADLRMGLFNADGSEAEMSGNGMRCFVKYAVERGLITLRDGVASVETLAGVISAEVRQSAGLVESVRVTMGRPRFRPQEIPVALAAQLRLKGEAEPPLQDVEMKIDGQTFAVTCLSMGNPHAVHFIDEPVEHIPLAEIGPKAERHALFPERVNFEVARVLARDRIDVRTWERGVGETLACGTGAAAVMVAARLRGLVDDRAELREPGGVLTLEWTDNDVYLTGPAVEVYEGEWPE